MSTFRQYKSDIKEHTTDRTQLRETVSRDVEAFLASGHQITQIPDGIGKGLSEFIDKPGKAAKRGGQQGAKMKRGQKYRAESYRRVQARLNARAEAKGKAGHTT